ncbi:MAG: mannosyl-oligosaccharide alpha-1,2-mannosidase [Vezdaea aestivalis]|nr:MAG: mannosyl-oligosaccharide alpha-1,2-mannosidase [Vezdaea aestivalis]
MAFSMPRNVPSFNAEQRQIENHLWGSSGRTSGGSNILGDRLNGFFTDPKLPMYKDKPYYQSAIKRKPLYQRKRGLLFGAVAFGLVLWYLGAFEGRAARERYEKGKQSLSWLRPGEKGRPDWNRRREMVKGSFVQSWEAYERHAWGKDIFEPIAQRGHVMTEKGLGWIIVDSLDTLILMNLTSHLSNARDWIATSLDYDQDTEVNTFETTIRMLGGLLSAHYLSNTFPELATLTDDDAGAAGEDLYLEKASDLAGRLLSAFSSQSGIPYSNAHLKDLSGVPSRADSGAASTAEAGSVQLELKYLAKLTGETNWWEVAEKVIAAIDKASATDGLVPIFIYPESALFQGENIRLGSRGDSYYEYLIKQYLQTSKSEPVYLEMWNEALQGMRKHLLTLSEHANLWILAERPSGLESSLSPKMDHLVCFLPGTIALAATGGAPLSKARKQSTWTLQHDADMEMARELMKTCWAMYAGTATGLAAEITHFKIHEPPIRPGDANARKTVEKIDASDPADAPWRADIDIHAADTHNLQRPETVESLLYMYRITGDEMYREWGWEMFQSFVMHTAVSEGKGGYTSLENVMEVPAKQRDNMESFWLAETLKYLYLLFSDKDFMNLEEVVFNTEAHPMPTFELGQLFKTGWQRNAIKTPRKKWIVGEKNPNPGEEEIVIQTVRLDDQVAKPSQ